jgi:hypothetical protein
MLACLCTEARFLGGGACEGLLTVETSGGTFFQACGRNAGSEEAMVACRQLGCNPTGAVRVDATL